MSQKLIIRIEFLSPIFHGLGDKGEPEWPPSPLRLFQAMVRSASGLFHGDEFKSKAAPWLAWLEALPSPMIFAPETVTGFPLRSAVPNNDLDLLARAWAKGKRPDKTPANFKALKTVWPSHLKDGTAVLYLWDLEGAPPPPTKDFSHLSLIASHLFVLGWGVDLVVGHAEVTDSADAAGLTGKRWQPSASGMRRLRVPATGMLNRLRERHRKELARLEGGGYSPQAPMVGFLEQPYHALGEPAPLSAVVFNLLRLDGRGFQGFDPVAASARLAAMVRHTAALVADEMGWPSEQINTRIHGHTPDGQSKGESSSENPRLAFLPAPSLEPRGPGKLTLGAARRVLVASSSAELVRWARLAMAGRELMDEERGKPVAILAPVPESDNQARHYLQKSAAWVTATPVVLPGYDEGVSAKRDSLIRKALRQAGVPDRLLDLADITCSPAGFLAGQDLANRYRKPARLTNPSVHVRIVWRDEKGNPIALAGPWLSGSARFRGLGLFVAQPD
jgi:CRISPR-associated protein Csb2